ncbi:MAG: hypothetical protein KAX49_18170 [Halanaerobiales bacterium]|nr:hypothetical protein [Halanaerobiales bacterium]
MIITFEGYKAIEDIQPGDLVLSKDEITGKEEYKSVVQTFVRTTDIIIEIILENGEQIDATEEHPFWVVGIGWVEAKNLNANSVLVLAGDSYVGVESVEVIEVGHEIKVYNFEVQDYHTYFVGSGIWVHNSCGIFAKGAGKVVDPKTIRFTQDSIGQTFGKTTQHAGQSVDDLIKGLKSGGINSNDIPAIRIFDKNEKIYSLDNRRLYAFQEAGVKVNYKWATAEEVANEAWKFNPINDGLSIRVRGKR